MDGYHGHRLVKCASSRPPMLNPTKRWLEFEAAYQREAYRDLSFREALSIFEALWKHAELLHPGFAEASRYDFEADFRVARALNGLPPA